MDFKKEEDIIMHLLLKKKTKKYSNEISSKFLNGPRFN
jgi:hypothetical protein